MTSELCLSNYKCKKNLPSEELDDDNFCSTCEDTYNKLQIINKNLPKDISNLIGEFLCSVSFYETSCDAFFQCWDIKEKIGSGILFDVPKFDKLDIIRILGLGVGYDFEFRGYGISNYYFDHLDTGRGINFYSRHNEYRVGGVNKEHGIRFIKWLDKQLGNPVDKTRCILCNEEDGYGRRCLFEHKGVTICGSCFQHSFYEDYIKLQEDVMNEQKTLLSRISSK